MSTLKYFPGSHSSMLYLYFAEVYIHLGKKGDKSSRCSCKTFHILLQLLQEASDRTTDAAASTEKDLQSYRNSLQEDILKKAPPYPARRTPNHTFMSLCLVKGRGQAF